MTLLTLSLIAAFGLVLVEGMTRGALTRRVYRELVRAFILLDLGATALVRKLCRPRFVLLGQCHQCGVCCQQILAAPPRFVRNTFLLKPFLWYHQAIHSFREVGRGPDDVIILSCGRLSPEGRCRIYRFRPLLCRNYPELPFFEAPRLLPGCGFYTAPRVVTRMKNRSGLGIVNRFVPVHHPSPAVAGESIPEHYELVDDSERPPRV